MMNLLERQKRILQIRWRNFARRNPSQELARGLFDAYDQTVAQLKFQVGENAPICQFDSELWDVYVSSFDDPSMANPLITVAEAQLHLKLQR